MSITSGSEYGYPGYEADEIDDILSAPNSIPDPNKPKCNDIGPDKFIVYPAKEKSVTLTIRIDKTSCDKIEDLAEKSGRSRNEIINMAIRFALDKAVYMEYEKRLKQ